MGRRFSKHLVGKKQINTLQSAFCFTAAWEGAATVMIALSYCRNKVPKAILKEESTREGLLI